MAQTVDDGIEGEESPAEIKALLSSIITPGELVLWVGRPEPGSLVRRSLPKSLLGFAFLAFTVFWMIGVVQGKNNNWDRGRAVAPFAPHNVLIAAFAGLWFLPPGLYMLTWPLRTWKARRTVYVLTDRRAVVIEPGFLGRSTGRSYPPEGLALMWCNEQVDGSGDLVFDNRKTWVGMPQAVGFLAVGRVREVEAQVRKALAPGRPDQGPSLRPHGRPDVGDRTFRISAMFRLHQVVALAVGVITAFCLIGNLALALVALVIMPRTALALLASFAAENGWPGPVGVAGSIVIGVGSLIGCGLVAWAAFRLALDTPTEITLCKDGVVEFRSWLRTRSLRATDITKIATGGWTDPNHHLVVIRHKSGRVGLFNQFPDFRDLLATLKALNPAIEVRGF